MHDSITFTIPYLPKSVNHYKSPSPHGGFFVVKEAKKYLQDMSVFIAGRRVGIHDGTNKSFYEAFIAIYLGKGQRGDADNFLKLIQDGLAKGGAIHNDDAILDLYVKKRRDRNNPRVTITVRVIPRPEGY